MLLGTNHCKQNYTSQCIGTTHKFWSRNWQFPGRRKVWNNPIDQGLDINLTLYRPLPKSFQRATGFAEQMDIHESTATVRESLQFSALLRQPTEVLLKEKYDYCEKVIDLMEMRSIAGATVGSNGSGLNQEQRKRLTIAVELASKPELLLFLDEPTSGLDSLAAFNIVRFLRRLADAGQAVLCTIHQPSAVL